jgi:uncharacterized lipoprotein YajG
VKSLRRSIARFATLAVLGGCAYQSQVIHLNPAVPNVDTTASIPANRREVLLVTRDARSFLEIGRRAEGSRTESAITTDSDIAVVLRSKVTEILEAKGFRVASARASAIPTLEVELRELSYRQLTEAGKRKVTVQVVLGTSVKNGAKAYRNNVRADQEQKILLEPVAKTNENWINETFAAALEALAKDRKLFSTLEPAPGS